MYIIVEKSEGNVYCYVEDKNQFLVNEKERMDSGLRRLNKSMLDYECDLGIYGDDVYFVFSM
jgi:hypothetical protein